MYLINVFTSLIFILLAIDTYSLVSNVPASGFCPTNCVCNFSNLSCQTLEVIPTNLADVGPPYITSINMSFNEIDTVKQGDFTGLHLLRSLDLSHNMISVLLAESFQGLWTLTYLNISHNSIEFIQEKVFDGLINLRILNLSYNSITSIFGGIFEQMVHLKSLNLSHNNVKVLLNDAFRGLNDLENLYIHDNEIRYIESNTIGSLRNLKTISIRGNGGDCECPWIRLLSRLEFYNIIVIDRDYFTECGNLSFECNLSITTTSEGILSSQSTNNVTRLRDTDQSPRLALRQLVHLEVRDGILFDNGSSTSYNISSKEAEEYVLRYDHVVRNRINKIEDEKRRKIMSDVFHQQITSFVRMYFKLESTLATSFINQTSTNNSNESAANMNSHLVAEESSMIVVATCIPIISFFVIYFTIQFVQESRKDKGYVEISPEKNSNQNRQDKDDGETSKTMCFCVSCLNSITAKLAVRKKYMNRSLDEQSPSGFKQIHEETKVEIDKKKQKNLSMVSSLRKKLLHSLTKDDKNEDKKNGVSLQGECLEPEYCRPEPKGSGTVVYSSDEESNSERSWDETVMLNTNANHSACSDPNDAFFEEIELP